MEMKVHLKPGELTTPPPGVFSPENHFHIWQAGQQSFAVCWKGLQDSKMEPTGGIQMEPLNTQAEAGRWEGQACPGNLVQPCLKRKSKKRTGDSA